VIVRVPPGDLRAELPPASRGGARLAITSLAFMLRLGAGAGCQTTRGMIVELASITSARFSDCLSMALALLRVRSR